MTRRRNIIYNSVTFFWKSILNLCSQDVKLSLVCNCTLQSTIIVFFIPSPFPSLLVLILSLLPFFFFIFLSSFSLSFSKSNFLLEFPFSLPIIDTLQYKSQVRIYILLKKNNEHLHNNMTLFHGHYLRI